MILCNDVEGYLHDLEIFSEKNISLEVIATGLSNQCRYNGQVKKFYSVAEHSVLLSRFAGKRYSRFPSCLELQMYMLLHDASEAYLGDIISKLKPHLPKYKELEDNIQTTILEYYGVKIEPALMELADRLDHDICKIEMVKLQEVKADLLINWINEFSFIPRDFKLKNWKPKKAKKEFEKEFRSLTKKIKERNAKNSTN